MHSRRIREKIKEDYNAIASEFSDTRRFPWKEFDAFLPYYRSDFSVLDLGCGNGRLLTFLEKYGYSDYLGVDQAGALLDLARQAWPKADFLEADMAELNLKQRFDALFAIASFHHLPPEDRLATLKMWRTFLKPGGVLFMTNWNLYQRRFWPLWWRAFLSRVSPWASGLPILWKGQQERTYFPLTGRELKKLLRQAGFTVLEQSSCLRGANLITIVQA